MDYEVFDLLIESIGGRDYHVSALLWDGEHIVAQARPAGIHIDIPEPPTYKEAEHAVSRYIGFEDHDYPTCFGCGPQRAERDGLRIFPSPVPGRNLVAAPWVPDDWLANEQGNVKSEYIWAALDCPGGIAVSTLTKRIKILLGKLVAQIDDQIRPGERCVVTGWAIGGEGRKHYSGMAVHSEFGDLYARARATWIAV
jgi:hypothetical protein